MGFHRFDEMGCLRRGNIGVSLLSFGWLSEGSGNNKQDRRPSDRSEGENYLDPGKLCKLWGGPHLRRQLPAAVGRTQETALHVCARRSIMNQTGHSRQFPQRHRK